MPASNGIRDRGPDATTLAEHCDSCGRPTGRLNDQQRCLYCEQAFISGDIDAATAALDVLAGAVQAALSGHAHPEDILRTVGRVIVADGKPSAQTLDWLGFLSQQNQRQRLIAHGLES